MFAISSYIASIARHERYFISSFRYTLIYSLACVVRLVEVCLLLAIIWVSIWLLSFAF